MRIAGHDKLSRAQLTMLLQRGDAQVELMLTALPIGYVLIMLRGMPRPKPVRTGRRKDAAGNRLNDDDGNPLWATNEDTPEFQAAAEEWANRAAAYRIYLALREDPTVTFTAELDAEGQTLPEFCDLVLAELTDAGFGERDLFELSMAAMSLGGDLSAATDAAKNG